MATGIEKPLTTATRAKKNTTKRKPKQVELNIMEFKKPLEVMKISQPKDVKKIKQKNYKVLDKVVRCATYTSMAIIGYVAASKGLHAIVGMGFSVFAANVLIWAYKEDNKYDMDN